jgi:hypothetical protein
MSAAHARDNALPRVDAAPGRDQAHARRAAGAFTRAHPTWSGSRGLNSWPRPWQGRALPAELHPRGAEGKADQHRSGFGGELLKSGAASHEGRRCRPRACMGARGCRAAGESIVKKQEARILAETGPL